MSDIFNYTLKLLNQTASHESLITIKKMKSYCLLVWNTIRSSAEGATQHLAKVQCSNCVGLRWDSSSHIQCGKLTLHLVSHLRYNFHN